VSRATPQLRKFAKQLIAFEAKGAKSAGATDPAAFAVSDKLRPHLATLMGNAGFRALLARALALAKIEIPWLRAVQVKPDGTCAGLETLHAQLIPEEFREGRVVLVAQLLGLLIAFIGESLTLGLVREVWPTIPLNDLELSNGGKNEKTN
jgi:hypothetical protein